MSPTAPPRRDAPPRNAVPGEMGPMPERLFSLPPVIGDGPAAGDDPGGGGDGSDVPRRRPAGVVLSSGSDRVASSPDRAFDRTEDT